MMDRPTSFAIATPSRGLVHSRTIEAVLANLATADIRGTGWFLTHDLPIPDCDEHVAELALASGAEAVWFIEEDVIPPTGALSASLDLSTEYPVVAIDYPVGDPADSWTCLQRDPVDGTILWCGLGCTLVRREVFETLARPWFSTMFRWVDYHNGAGWQKELAPESNDLRYGHQDIYFGFALREAGFRIGQVPGMTASHAYVAELGRQGTNVGAHKIGIRDHVIKGAWPGPINP
jgi:hypothetical protein